MSEKKMTVKINPFSEVEQVAEVEQFIHARVGEIPSTAIVLGSGLGYFAENIEARHTFDSREIPGYPQPTVEGHSGKLIFGTIDGVPLIAIQGRSHFYEGRTIAEVTFYVQLLHQIGVKNLILTNATGGIRPDMRPGDFVVLTDAISFTQIEIFPPQETEKSPFDFELTELAKRVASERKIRLLEGVYCWTTGPSYETSLEIKTMRDFGADVVGMSTVPEALVARHLGMKVLGISLVTNLAAGIGQKPLSHVEVQQAAESIKKPYSIYISAVIVEMHKKEFKK
ncbi:MAG: purine-nucleoside phosphorylase [Candidatus Marinimicrobia bacterium]|nr:purine-nucleoside phosphorylase [Candidatus Neomarinimicrobiota bacterium]